MLAATELVYGAVDVLDSRYEGFKVTLGAVVADMPAPARSTWALSPGDAQNSNYICWAGWFGWTARLP